MFKAPEAVKLKAHTYNGKHWEIIGRLAAHPKFQEWMTVALRVVTTTHTQTPPEQRPAISYVFCVQGTHSSVAPAISLMGITNEAYGNPATTRPTVDSSKACGCGDCGP